MQFPPDDTTIEIQEKHILQRELKEFWGKHYDSLRKFNANLLAIAGTQAMPGMVLVRLDIAIRMELCREGRSKICHSVLSKNPAVTLQGDELTIEGFKAFFEAFPRKDCNAGQSLTEFFQIFVKDKRIRNMAWVYVLWRKGLDRKSIIALLEP
ncbi:hypothetical protein VFPPC_09151 [Pochonia chlamydosporia 170]|uniref:Uncharacterized protein n=1 Tax=Pochonia chlamydosporia 170 TaxID=1380566 RepID=A0A179FCR8_METCM|nr:hypothetical protein VFPPC_09151 [Pochonia chlamydosporia 170]OAQ63282.1 hypothetical protein VFPPC_09151 [Pochonia chlamydosporia 170]